MTSEQIALLKGELKDARYEGKTAREIARMLSFRSLIPNPDPQPQVPRRLSAEDAAALNLTDIGDEMMSQLHEAIQAQDNVALMDWATLAIAGGLINSQLGARIQTYAEGTVPDPDWCAEVPGTSLLMALGIRVLEWGGMTFFDSIPRGAVEEVQNG